MLTRLQFGYRPGKRTKAYLRHHLYLPRLQAGVNIIHLVSAEFNHEWPSRQVTLGIGIRKALNIRSIEERSISVYQRYSRTYELRPRTFYFLVNKTF